MSLPRLGQALSAPRLACPALRYCALQSCKVLAAAVAEHLGVVEDLRVVRGRGVDLEDLSKARLKRE